MGSSLREYLGTFLPQAHSDLFVHLFYVVVPSHALKKIQAGSSSVGLTQALALLIVSTIPSSSKDVNTLLYAIGSFPR